MRSHLQNLKQIAGVRSTVSTAILLRESDSRSLVARHIKQVNNNKIAPRQAAPKARPATPAPKAKPVRESFQPCLGTHHLSPVLCWFVSFRSCPLPDLPINKSWHTYL